MSTIDGKVCSACKEWKSYSQYWRCTAKSDGFQTQCKACEGQRARQRREQWKQRPRLTSADGGKVCSVCKGWKSYSEYCRDVSTSDGFRTGCKACESQRAKLRLKMLQAGPPRAASADGGKVCRICNQWKLYSEYWRATRSSDGFQHQCKVCISTYQQHTYEQRKQAPRLTSADGGKVCRICNQWKPYSEYRRDTAFRDNLDSTCRVCKVEQLKRRVMELQGGMAEGDKVCRVCGELKPYSDYRPNYSFSNGRDSLCKSCEKTQRRRNPERVRVTRMRRVSRIRGAAGSYTLEEWLMMCEHFGNICLACGSSGPLTVDHVIPLSRGGTNDIQNLQPLCLSCNSRKNARTADYRDPAMLAGFLQRLLEMN